MMIKKGSSLYNQQRLYSDLAWIFPIISPPDDYLEESKLLSNYIQQFAKRPVNTLLNLGCGTGHHDFGLKQYFQITGIDLSETMLAMARKLNPEVNYQLGDFTKLDLNQRYDAITILDAVDYILSEQDLQHVIQTAYDLLNPGGVVLIFPDDVKDHFQNNHVFTETRERDDIQITYIENMVDLNPQDTQCEVTYIYLIRQAGQLEVEIDHHVCGLFSLSSWQQLFKTAGFELTQQTYTPHDAALDRRYLIFLGTKPV